ncbi:DUF4349 domain-containing protein [Chryseobacterium geocarposphaerae]|uniref:Uncharacterized protein DUF4349 n=1 Tax=Chryseobacterium geocarposphaerae TaxID=1416776 RepID=A0A2M9C5J3_9FLAO|nr:DUF4349 domain-containing protein [Chryseobacterium geocarposphaerae]PJJ66101.1 uncharacterized protein DUF4349 [Chryseobacterium geocarposphaerae]
MKKFILLVAVSGTFIMCKKGESAVSKLENATHSADSTISAASEKINEINNTANAVLDSADIKIKDFENTKERVKEQFENTSKIVDSLSDKISSVKLETKKEKQDSAKKEEKIVVNVPAPKVIKETKIIYKDKPKSENFEVNVPKNKMVKTGYLSINANNAETVKEIIKEETIKNNGFIKKEELTYVATEPSKDKPSEMTDQKIYYLQIKVPIQNFDYLMDDLSNNISDIQNKNVEVKGNNYSSNTICDITISIMDNVDKTSETFGDKSFAAVSSGWNVITSIFLFILPLWPLFLIAGIGYYFYKKKNKNTPNKDSDSL